jgi:hypothetical protein
LVVAEEALARLGGCERKYKGRGHEKVSFRQAYPDSGQG